LIYWGCEDKKEDNDDNDKNVDEIVFNLEPRLNQDENEMKYNIAISQLMTSRF
jgi:hypothetical protein